MSDESRVRVVGPMLLMEGRVIAQLRLALWHAAAPRGPLPFSRGLRDLDTKARQALDFANPGRPTAQVRATSRSADDKPPGTDASLVPMDANELLDTETAAKELGVSTRWVQIQSAAIGTAPHPGRGYRFRREDVERYRASRGGSRA